MPSKCAFPAAGPGTRVGVPLRDAVLREDAVRIAGEEFASRPGGRALWLDLAGVEFATAGGMGELIALHKDMQAVDGELILCNVGERAYEVFELARLTEVLDVRPGMQGW